MADTNEHKKTFEIKLIRRVPILDRVECDTYLSIGERHTAFRSDKLIDGVGREVQDPAAGIIALPEPIKGITEVLVFGDEYEIVEPLTLLAEAAE